MATSKYKIQIKGKEIKKIYIGEKRIRKVYRGGDITEDFFSSDVINNSLVLGETFTPYTSISVSENILYNHCGANQFSLHKINNDNTLSYIDVINSSFWGQDNAPMSIHNNVLAMKSRNGFRFQQLTADGLSFIDRSIEKNFESVKTFCYDQYGYFYILFDNSDIHIYKTSNGIPEELKVSTKLVSIATIVGNICSDGNFIYCFTKNGDFVAFYYYSKTNSYQVYTLQNNIIKPFSELLQGIALYQKNIIITSPISSKKNEIKMFNFI